MDFTLVSLESLVGPTHPESSSGAPYEGISEANPPKGILGSGFVKQQRRGLEVDEWRSSKVSKTVDLSSSSVNKAMQFSQGITNGSPLLGSNPLLFSGLHDNYAPQNQQQQQQQQQQEYMLSFSSQKPETLSFWGKDSGALAFPYYQRMPTIYSRNAGYSSGSLNASMHVPYAGIRGPFTPSQWIELEHQALIYKYLTSNVPVPSNLLIPLKKSLNPYALSGSSSSPLPPKSWWGSFHLGYGDNTDPEPGRCRRTDGKKWRCSRDAVADQKYCERHINRGRHRSRKPVEGQTGHAASRAATTSKVVLPMTSSDSTVMSSAMPIGGASNSLTTISQSDAAAAVANPSTDAAVVNRIQDLRGLSGMSSSSTVNLKSNDTGFNILRQEIVTEGSSHSEFGLVSTDSLLNPSQESSYIDTKNYDTSSFLDFSGQEAQDQLLLHHFIDDWPKDNSDQSVITWPEDMKSDWINLSMSIPMTSSDFSSSSNSPKHEKLPLSPLRLFREFEPEQVNLGPTDELGEAAAAAGGGPKQTNWVPPISWGGSSCSMGGPLGEVLTNTSGGNTKASYKNNPSSSLNLLTEGWDGSSPQVGSSPTGVLQKSTFCSLSNSSSESSPRATGHHNRNINSDEASIYDDVLGSTLAASSVPTL